MKETLIEFCDFCNYDKSYINKFIEFKQQKNIDQSQIDIFTDGACKSNGKINAKAGIGIYIENVTSISTSISQSIQEVIDELLPGLDIGKATNQKAELLAILKALKISEEFNKIINIKTDSMYCINIFTKWYKAWEKNGWKTSTGKAVLNKEIILAILKYIKYKQIKFTYVPAHQNEPNDPLKYKDWYGNKKADELAVKSISINILIHK